MKEDKAKDPGDKGGKAGRGGLAFLLTSSMLGLQFLRQRMRRPAGTAHPSPVPSPPHSCKGAAKTSGITLEKDGNDELIRRRRRGTPLILCAFAVGMGGGIGFMYLYWNSGSTQWLGSTLALCLGGFGALLVLYAHWIVRHELVAAPREEMPSGREEREQFYEVFSSGADDIQRRSLLKWMGAGAVALFAAIFVSLFRSLAREVPQTMFTTVWKPGQRLVTMQGKTLTVESLEPGSTMTVFPEDNVGSVKAQTVLIRVDPNLLRLPEGRTDWAPMGYVAYSRVCTHAGCSVGMFEANSNLLLCPCHQSTFDVLRGAIPTGGPAARALPQLPLYVDSDGKLCARGGFTGPPGPGFTGMPA